MIKLENEKSTQRLIVLGKKFDELSPFGKELMFSFLMGYSQATSDEMVYEAMVEEMEKLNQRFFQGYK